MSSPVAAVPSPIVNPVVERAVMAEIEATLPPVMNTSGVAEYGTPKTIAQLVAAVAVVTSPVTSFELVPSVPVPVPHAPTVGVAVLEAISWPY